MKTRRRIRSVIKWSGAAVTVLLLIVWVGSAWYSNVADRKNLPAPGAVDLGLLQSPDGSHQVRVFAGRQGALGWDRIWIYATDSEGHENLLLNEKVMSSSPPPIDWLSSSVLQVTYLNERDQSITRRIDLAQLPPR